MKYKVLISLFAVFSVGTIQTAGDNEADKPKEMHWKTQDRLIAEAQYYDQVI